MRRLLQRLVHDEDGVALIMALAIMMVLAVTTTGLLVAGSANQRESLVSDNARVAFGIAQEGLAYAEGMVYGAAASHNAAGVATGWQTLTNLPDGSTCTTTVCGQYSASVGGDGVTWTMYGTGTYHGVTRTVHAQANVPSPVTSSETAVWNYLYADGTGSCTTWNGNVTVTVPILVRGDLCLGGSQSFTGATLEVGGNLTVTGSAKVGSAGKPIQEVKVGLTSTSTNTCNGLTPGTSTCDGKHSPVYASTVGEGVDVTPSMPCIGQPSSWDATCTGSNDGTWTSLHSTYNNQASLPKSGCPTNLFDNDTTLNNSDTSITSVLLGSTAYDCKLGSTSSPCSSTVTTCELKWTPSTSTLSATGEFYFDGSLTISGNTTYTGLATFFFTGGVTTTGSPTFCASSAKSGNSTCTAAWDTTKDGLIMVAGCWSNSTGSSLTTSGCVSLGGNSTGAVRRLLRDELLDLRRRVEHGPGAGEHPHARRRRADADPVPLLPARDAAQHGDDVPARVATVQLVRLSRRPGGPAGPRRRGLVEGRLDRDDLRTAGCARVAHDHGDDLLVPARAVRVRHRADERLELVVVAVAAGNGLHGLALRGRAAARDGDVRSGSP